MTKAQENAIKRIKDLAIRGMVGKSIDYDMIKKYDKKACKIIYNIDIPYEQAKKYALFGELVYAQEEEKMKRKMTNLNVAVITEMGSHIYTTITASENYTMNGYEDVK